jgi:hypothetical protein
MNDAPMKFNFTLKDYISLGTIVALISAQWAFNSARIASAEERVVRIERNDESQSKSEVAVQTKLVAIEKDTQYLTKQVDKQQAQLEKILEELQKIKK